LKIYFLKPKLLCSQFRPKIHCQPSIQPGPAGFVQPKSLAFRPSDSPPEGLSLSSVCPELPPPPSASPCRVPPLAAIPLAHVVEANRRLLAFIFSYQSGALSTPLPDSSLKPSRFENSPHRPTVSSSPPPQLATTTVYKGAYTPVIHSATMCPI
jgi:hypothetical protein